MVTPLYWVDWAKTVRTTNIVHCVSPVNGGVSFCAHCMIGNTHGKDIQDFIKLNPLPSAEKLTKQKFERLNANIKFKNSINSVLKKAKFV